MVDPRSARLAVALSVAWVVATMLALVWVWGGPGRTVHQSPDEAIAARSIAAVVDHGDLRTALTVDDPGDMVRPRMWVEVDGELAPASPPTALLFYGMLHRLPGGAWLQFLIPALAIGAMVLAAGLALPSSWTPVAGLMPALAFPATYWLLRPWHTTSLALAATCAAALAGVSAVRWRPHLLANLLYVMLVLSTIGALVRPDQTHVLLACSLLIGLGAGMQWRHWLLLHAVAGVVVVGGSMALNLTTTGSLTTAAVDLVDVDDAYRPFGGNLGFPWKHILLILLPNGWPGLDAIGSALAKYWLRFGPIALIVLAAGATGWASTRPRIATEGDADRRRWQLALMAVAGVAAVQAFTRISDSDLGARATDPGLVHSYPRYSAIAYLIVAAAALAGPATLASTGRRMAARLTAAGLAVASAGAVVLVLTAGLGSEGLSSLRGLLREADAFAAAIDESVPDDAVVFSHKLDKYLWSVRPTAVVARDGRLPDEATILADRVAHATESVLADGRTPVLLEITDEEAAELAGPLAELGLCLVSTPSQLPPVTGIATYLPVRVVSPIAGGCDK